MKKIPCYLSENEIKTIIMALVEVANEDEHLQDLLNDYLATFEEGQQ